MPQAIPGLDGWRHLGLDDVDSTNVVALRHGRQGDPGYLWVTGKRQLAGRGRRGRTWVSEAGNLYATLLLVAPEPKGRVGLLPLVAALALHDALEPLVRGRATAELKWPNDVLLDGAKCSGILLEAATRVDGTPLIVIGCGVNCTHHPEEGLYKSTSLAALGVKVSPDELFASMAKAMAQRLIMWAAPDGAEHVSHAFLDRAAGLNQPLIVRYSDAEERGTFAGLDAEGYLLLQQEDGVRRVLAGDVFFDRPTT